MRKGTYSRVKPPADLGRDTLTLEASDLIRLGTPVPVSVASEVPSETYRTSVQVRRMLETIDWSFDETLPGHLAFAGSRHRDTYSSSERRSLTKPGGERHQHSTSQGRPARRASVHDSPDTRALSVDIDGSELVVQRILACLVDARLQSLRQLAQLWRNCHTEVTHPAAKASRHLGIDAVMAEDSDLAMAKRRASARVADRSTSDASNPSELTLSGSRCRIVTEAE
jgi:hypothetical protein